MFEPQLFFKLTLIQNKMASKFDDPYIKTFKMMKLTLISIIYSSLLIDEEEPLNYFLLSSFIKIVNSPEVVVGLV